MCSRWLEKERWSVTFLEVKCSRIDAVQVAFNYRSESSKTSATALSDAVRSVGSEALAIQMDIADPDAGSRIVAETLSGFNASSIDILVNNAGLGGNTALEEVTVEEYEELMAVNVRAVLFMTQAFVKQTRRGGRIINLSSISARGGYATQSVYAASKAAVEGFTRVWATELGHKYGVTVNAINPGPVETDMYFAAGEVHLARMAKENEKTPAAPRAGTAKDIADIVCLLCEERSRWITGDIICANGGLLFT